ncbi:MAG: ABC transporter transmembrane domain-containing protein [Magnetococcus sp. DMHC-6]
MKKLEKLERTISDKELLKNLFSYLLPYKKYIVVAILCMILISGLTSLQAYLIKPVLDKIFIEKNQLYFNILPWIIFIVFLLKGMTYFFYQYYLERVGQSVVKDLRLQLFVHLHRQSLAFFHNHTSGELMSRLMSDVAIVQSTVSSATVGMIKDTLEMVGLIGLIFYLNWELAIFCFGFIMIAFLPVIFFSRLHRRLSTRIQENNADLTAIVNESIKGNPIIKAFGMEHFEAERFGHALLNLFHVTVYDVKMRKISHSIMELLGGIGIISIIVFGGQQVMDGTSSTGTFFSFLTALVMIYEPIKGITKVNSSIQHGLAAFNRVTWLLNQQPQIQNKPEAISLPPFNKEICFSDVFFKYDHSDKQVLRGVDLKIAKGQKVAIVGHSGSGKTTVANLLPRFFDVTGGGITIDGFDIRDVTFGSLREQISVVTQDTILFNDTIRNNIAYGLPECSEERLLLAARQANAMEFIVTLPKQFETIIGESGVRFSGGQRQRLAVARAFLKNAPILILDEATSALDTESERLVQNAIEQLMEGRTVLLIAHRLSTVERADLIVLMKDGQIIEQGTHAELLNQPESEYRKFHTLQSRLIEE